jgi:hypothetical protein
MPRASSSIALCTYRVKKGKEAAFEKLLARHYPTLARLGWVADEPRMLFRGTDESGKTFYLEVLPWKGERYPRMAHEHPDVLAVWHAMDALCEERLGRPSMEFPHARQLRTKGARGAKPRRKAERKRAARRS